MLVNKYFILDLKPTGPHKRNKDVYTYFEKHNIHKQQKAYYMIIFNKIILSYFKWKFSLNYDDPNALFLIDQNVNGMTGLRTPKAVSC